MLHISAGLDGLQLVAQRRILSLQAFHLGEQCGKVLVHSRKDKGVFDRPGAWRCLLNV